MEERTGVVLRVYLCVCVCCSNMEERTIPSHRRYCCASSKTTTASRGPTTGTESRGPELPVELAPQTDQLSPNPSMAAIGWMMAGCHRFFCPWFPVQVVLGANWPHLWWVRSTGCMPKECPKLSFLVHGVCSINANVRVVGWDTESYDVLSLWCLSCSNCVPMSLWSMMSRVVFSSTVWTKGTISTSFGGQIPIKST